MSDLQPPGEACLGLLQGKSTVGNRGRRSLSDCHFELSGVTAHLGVVGRKVGRVLSLGVHETLQRHCDSCLLLPRQQVLHACSTRACSSSCTRHQALTRPD